MVGRFSLAVGLAILAVPSLGFVQQKPTSVMPLVAAPGWDLVRSEAASLDAVTKWGGDPEVEREYGVKAVTERTYQFENHAVDVLVEPAADPSSAYGLLTYYESDDPSKGSGDKDASRAPGHAMLLTWYGSKGVIAARGAVFFRIGLATNPPLAPSDLDALLVEAGGPPPSPRAMESLPAPLPRQGLITGSEKYLVGPVAASRVLRDFPSQLLGFNDGAEVQVGDYAEGPNAQHQVTLVQISCPTTQLAKRQFDAISQAVSLSQDRGAGSVYGRRAGTFVLLALGAERKPAADKFLDEFTVTRQVSWDQRYPGDKSVVLQMVELVLANMMLVVILASFSVVGGVLVFLGMRVTRKRLAASGIAAGEESGIITLHLG